MANSRFIIVWDLTVLLVVIFVCWLYTFEAAFTHLKPQLGYSAKPSGPILLAFTYILDIMLVADIFVSMKKVIVLSTEMQANPREIFISYVTSKRFVLDVLAVLPIELCSLIWLPSHQTWMYFPLFRLNRLLKLWKVVAFIKSIENSLHFPITYVNFFKFVIYILTLTHIGACLWFTLSCFQVTNCLTNSWMHSHGITNRTKPWHDYIASFYWAAATTTTVGYGDISATNIREMIISIVVQLVGVVMYSYCLGSILATFNNTAISRSSFLGKLQAIKVFMSHHDKHGLIVRINSYFELLWTQYRGQAIPGEDGLMDDLPKVLYNEIMFRRCGALLNSVRFFHDLSSHEISQLACSVYFYRFAPGDVIVYCGDVGQQLYCVRRGHVEVLSTDLNSVISMQGQGSYFSVASFLGIRPCRHTIRAACHCEVVMLKREDADKIPSLKRKLKALSETAKRDLSAESYEDGLSRKDQRLKIIPVYSVAIGLVQAMNVISATTLKASVNTMIAKCTDDVDIHSQLLGPVCEAARNGSMRTYSHQHLTCSREMGDKDKENSQEATNNGNVELEVDDRRTKMYYKSHFYFGDRKLRKLLSYCIVPYVILPETRFKYIWKGCSFVLVIVFAVTVSLQAAFLHYSVSLWVVNYALDCYFILDMILNMHAAFRDSHGNLVSRPTACASHYLKTKFWIDLVSSFPLDFMILVMWTHLAEVSRALSLARVNRLLKLYKLHSIFMAVEGRIKSCNSLVRTFKLSLYLALGTHLAACGWFLLACSSLKVGPYDPGTCDVSSWVRNTHHISDTLRNSVLKKYIISLYWTIATTTSVGYGDISPHTNSERAYACLVMACGVLAYGYLIASSAASFVEEDNTRRQYEQKMNALKRYLKEQHVDENLIAKAMRHYKRIWKINKGMDISRLLSVMPPSLHADVSLNIYKSAIDQFPMFKNTGLSFSRLLSTYFKPVVYISGENIVRKWDPGHELYFVSSGTVEVVNENGSVVYTTIGNGHFFGETGLVFHYTYHTTARAATNCELFVLTKADLDFALTFYPDVRNSITSYIKERLELIDELRKRPEKSVRFKIPNTLGTYGKKVFYGLCKCYRSIVKFIIPHDGPLGVTLYWMGLIFSYICFFSTSYQGAFQVKEPILLYLNYFFEIFFIIEIILKCHRTYQDSNENTVKDSTKIAIHYLRTRFALDLIAVLPYELLAYLIVSDNSARESVFLYLRLLHLVRIVRFCLAFSDGHRNLRQRVVVLQLLKFFVLFTLVTQAVACIWYFLACHLDKCFPGTWATRAVVLPNDHKYHLNEYINSIYWAVVTMTTVGYGDLIPVTTAEVVFCMLVMVMGKFMLALILGLSVSAFISTDMEKMVFKNEFGALKKYLHSQNLFSGTRKRVLDMCEYSWSRNKGHSRTNILADLPSYMRASISMQLGENFLSKVHVFNNLDQAFLRQLSTTLQSKLYIPGEFIVYRGQVDFGVIFLCRGKVEIVQEEEKKTMKEGEIFGLASLLYGVASGASLKTVTHADIFTFSKKDFLEVCRNHPIAYQQLRVLAHQHYGLPVEISKSPHTPTTTK